MGVLAVDRRKHARFAVDLPLSYSRVDDKELFGGIVANASGGGILVYLPERMEIGAVLKIEIFYLKGLEIGSIETIAKVVWSDMANGGMQSEHRYGLEFQYIEQKDYSRLVALLKESGN
ncbi:MAG: PilZ domain-containing protein [Thermodesulfobacteriota bacterium]